MPVFCLPLGFPAGAAARPCETTQHNIRENQANEQRVRTYIPTTFK